MDNIKEQDINSPSVLMVLAILVNRFCPIYVNVVLCMITIAADVLFDSRNDAYTRMPGGTAYLSMLPLFLFGGLITYAPGERGYWPFLRDIIYFSGMFLYWAVGDIFAKKYEHSLASLYKTVVLYIGISCLIGVTQRLIALIRNGSSLYSLSLVGGLTQFTIAAGIYLLFLKPPCIGDYYFGKAVDTLLKVIVLLAFLVSFSRMTLLLVAVFLLVGGYRNLSKVLRLLAAVLIGVFVISYFVPGIMTTFIHKLVRSLTEISSSSTTYWNDAEVVANWRGYEVYKAKQEFGQYSLLEQLFGRGFGAAVDVGSYAYLVTGEKVIPYLHNGYYTTLIKGGYAGIALTALYFLSAIYYYYTADIDSYEKRLAYGIILSMAVSMTFIHGTFWGGESFLGMLMLARLSGGGPSVFSGAHEEGRTAP